MTPKRWIEVTGAVGIVSKQGRYAATYAHRDIAFEFASWISPEFKLYIIEDYQRLTWIKDAAHNSNDDQPDQVNRCIESFLRGLSHC